MKQPEPGTFWHFLHTLKRTPEDSIIAGICGGLSHVTPAPAWVWRALFLLSVFFGGMGAILYVILWIVMPAAPGGEAPAQNQDV
jgi:phage shock protein PspC (stress-responsive transcriptional regulator)